MMYPPDDEVSAKIRRLLLNCKEGAPPATVEDFPDIVQVPVKSTVFDLLDSLSQDLGRPIGEIVDECVLFFAQFLCKIGQKSSFKATRRVLSE